jgi:Family of unknown function (DUF5682)
MTWQIPVFGVRHLSPTGAWHLRHYLDRIRPTMVLIEGLADANELIGHLVKKSTKPPVAILAYTDSLPVRTLVYPIARYSPEYQAMKWADEHRAKCEFIDLPSDIFLALQDIEIELRARAIHEADDDKAEATPSQTSPEPRRSIHEEYARRSGEADYETYWERYFEHNLSDDSYRLAAFEFGRSLRELEQDTPRWRAENLVREAYMRRRIEEALQQGHKPEKIVAVVGAFHAPVLNGDHPPMTDGELASLRRRGSKLTLMPYSYFKLSSQSGYGAGNHAPAYFELFWDALQRDAFHELPITYLTLVTRHLRESGTHRSTAEVIEGVRLARTMSALKDGLAPTLSDLRDAAVTLIGHGELSTISEALARVDVGTAIGELPPGVSRTSIQSDFEREILRLKLDKYKTTVKQDLPLDLREDRRAKSEESAFLDLRRSFFLNRLRMLDVGFAKPVETRQQSATWAEHWQLQWSPECEISLIEAVLMGETVELAVGFQFKTRLEKCTSIAEAADMVRDACQCGLMNSMELARGRLQELTAASSDLVPIAHAAFQLGQTIRYGDVRKFDTSPLLPLVETLFVQGSLALHAAANCDNAAAATLLVSLDQMNKVALEYTERIDEPLWLDALTKLAEADDRNPLLSGYACALLLERGLMPNETLAREVSRRLSPGISADLGAGWFEGLAKRNRYALLARQPLWEQIAGYVASLDEEQFRRALVFLRRGFGDFGPQEKRHISENLGEYWGLNRDNASELLAQPLSESEEKKLEALNEFDFDDL